MNILLRLLYGAGVACVLIGVLILITSIFAVFGSTTHAVILIIIGIILAIVSTVIKGNFN